MDIGKEQEKEIWITAPTEQPVEKPQRTELPDPAESPLTPTPEKVPAGRTR